MDRVINLSILCIGFIAIAVGVLVFLLKTFNSLYWIPHTQAFNRDTQYTHFQFFVLDSSRNGDGAGSGIRANFQFFVLDS